MELETASIPAAVELAALALRHGWLVEVEHETDEGTGRPALFWTAHVHRLPTCSMLAVGWVGGEFLHATHIVGTHSEGDMDLSAHDLDSVAAVEKLLVELAAQ